MTKQVPEDDQMKVLEEFVTGNRAFAKLRGKLVGSIAGTVGDIVSSTSSPTEFLQQYDEFVATVRIIGNKLACFRRDGMVLAERQLTKALQARDHRLPFEATAPCPKQPFTVVMLDPERTLAMIRWLTMEFWKTLEDYLDGNRESSITNELFQAFPTLEANSRRRLQQGSFVGGDLVNSWIQTVEYAFDVESRTKFGKLSPRELFLSLSQYDDHIEISKVWSGRPYAYVVSGTQADVLSCFSREQQSLVGTWQLNVPDTMPLHSYGEIGFHIESEHSAWTEENPDYVSVSVNHGMGVIALRDSLDPEYGSDDLTVCKKLGGVAHLGWKNNPQGTLRFRLTN